MNVIKHKTIKNTCFKLSRNYTTKKLFVGILTILTSKKKFENFFKEELDQIDWI